MVMDLEEFSVNYFIMIIDHIDNLIKYKTLHPSIEEVVAFISSIELNALVIGKFKITNETISVSVSSKKGSNQLDAKFEAHNNHIDIQICIDGIETFGWKNRDDCKIVKEAYNQDKDVIFYSDRPDTYFQIKKNQFVIFFPNDVHAPMIGDNTIKKLVCKLTCV